MAHTRIKEGHNQNGEAEHENRIKGHRLAATSKSPPILAAWVPP